MKHNIELLQDEPTASNDIKGSERHGWNEFCISLPKVLKQRKMNISTDTYKEIAFLYARIYTGRIMGTPAAGGRACGVSAL